MDRRADLYSTAVMLFEMLAGRPPFVADTPLGVLMKHTTELPPRVTELRPALGGVGGLDALLHVGLAKVADERFANASDFIAAIDALDADGNVSAASSGAATGSSVGMAATMMAPATPIANASETVAASPAALSAGPGFQSLAAGGNPAPVSTAHVPATGGPDQRKRGRRGLAIAGAVLLAGVVVLVIVLALSKADRGALVKENIEKLKTAKTCEARREAVLALRELGSKEALPALKRARRRMRGGVLGLGARNQNRCLKKDAEEAIKYLRGLPD